MTDLETVGKKLVEELQPLYEMHIDTDFVMGLFMDEAKGTLEFEGQFFLDRMYFLLEVINYCCWQDVKKINQTAKVRGHSMKFENVEMRTFSMAGRIMITIEDSTNLLTVVGPESEDDNRPCGIQGVHGSCRGLRDMICNKLATHWDISKLKEDPKVSIL